MGKGQNLKPQIHAIIVRLNNCHHSEREIAHIGCSKTAVHNAINRLTTQEVIYNRHRHGRPRISNQQQDGALCCQVHRNCLTSVQQYKVFVEIIMESIPQSLRSIEGTKVVL